MMRIKNIKKTKITKENKKKMAKCGVLLAGYLAVIGIISFKETDYEIIPLEIVENKGVLLEDANGEWNNYKEKISVTYEVKESNYKNVLIMGLVEDNENERIYRSLTVPEITLVETIDKENYKVDYILQDKSLFPESNIEEFSETHNVTSVAWCIGGKDVESFEEIKKNEQDKEKMENKTMVVPSIFSETDKTLLKYNNWLEQVGSNKKLTQEDIKIIEAQTNSHPEEINVKKMRGIMNGTISIKIRPNEYRQVGVNEYDFVETEDGNLELRFNDCEVSDFLTGKEIRYDNRDVNRISTFKEFVIENDIYPVGYTTQVVPSWGDEDTQFIKEYYGEDILECLRENGFPLPCYDVNDFYKIYYESKFDILKLGLKK